MRCTLEHWRPELSASCITEVGTNYCSSNPNSSGAAAVLGGSGSASLADNICRRNEASGIDVSDVYFDATDPNAPIVPGNDTIDGGDGDDVIIGNGGAEFGVRGYVAAYDAQDGEELWRFHAGDRPAFRGLTYWRGDDEHVGRLVFTTRAVRPGRFTEPPAQAWRVGGGRGSARTAATTWSVTAP